LLGRKCFWKKRFGTVLKRLRGEFSRYLGRGRAYFSQLRRGGSIIDDYSRGERAPGAMKKSCQQGSEKTIVREPPRVSSKREGLTRKISKKANREGGEGEGNT